MTELDFSGVGKHSILPEYIQMKETMYLFPDKLSGYGPLTSKLTLPNGNGGMSVSCKGALICLALRVWHGMQLLM